MSRIKKKGSYNYTSGTPLGEQINQINNLKNIMAYNVKKEIEDNNPIDIDEQLKESDNLAMSAKEMFTYDPKPEPKKSWWSRWPRWNWTWRWRGGRKNRNVSRKRNRTRRRY